MTIDNDKITEIFCMADNFCRLYDRFIKTNGLARKRENSKRKYHRDDAGGSRNSDRRQPGKKLQRPFWGAAMPGPL